LGRYSDPSICFIKDPVCEELPNNAGMTRQTRTPDVLSIYCTLLYLCGKMNIRIHKRKLPKRRER
jgi:hypothetical protein